jgi:hypothetical protein
MVSELLLLSDNVLDVPILNRDEIFFGDFSLDQFIALLHEKVCPEQRAEVLSAEGRVLMTSHYEKTTQFFFDIHNRKIQKQVSSLKNRCAREQVGERGKGAKGRKYGAAMRGCSKSIAQLSSGEVVSNHKSNHNSIRSLWY